MGIARGPNLIKDNLVFGYDTGYGVADNETSTRFYPGETTENLIYDMGGTVTSAYPEVVYRSTATETNVIDTSAPGGKYSRFTGIDGSSNNQLYSRFSSYSIDVRGDSVNYSVYLKGSGTCHLTIYDNNSGYGTSPTITLTNNWVRYNYTRTVNASATSYWVAVRGVLNTTDVYIAGQQATRGTHATPYVENNRSSTESLIDLKRTADIDLSNVSFDSIGQPEFDGAGDYIDLPDSLITNLHGGTEASICIWIKNDTTVNGVGTSGIVQLSNYNSSNGCLWFYNNGYTYLDIFRTSRVEQVFTNNTEVSTNWNLLTVTTTPGTNGWKCYMNGVLKKQASGQSSVSVADIQGGLTIGRNSSSRYTNGKIAACQIYNRALTAAEVIQNYNAQKNRFNI